RSERWRNTAIAQCVASLAGRNGKVIFPCWPGAWCRISPKRSAAWNAVPRTRSQAHRHRSRVDLTDVLLEARVCGLLFLGFYGNRRDAAQQPDAPEAGPYHAKRSCAQFPILATLKFAKLQRELVVKCPVG